MADADLVRTYHGFLDSDVREACCRGLGVCGVCQYLARGVWQCVVGRGVGWVRAVGACGVPCAGRWLRGPVAMSNPPPPTRTYSSMLASTWPRFVP